MEPNMEEVILSVQNLISHLFSNSVEKKLEGESMFNEMKEQDPESLALHLAQFVGAFDSHTIDFRKGCADILYKLLTHDRCNIWNNNLCVSTQSTLRSILVIRINLEESSEYITETLCYTVSELCNISNIWPELLHFLRECITSNSNRLKGSFFLIFANLAQERCTTLVPDINILYSLFLKTMNDDTLNLFTRAGALAATINFILCLSSVNELKRVESLYPAMMKTLVDTLSEDDGDFAAQYVLRRFIKLAKNEPRFFRTYIVDVVNTMFEIAEAMNLKERTRQFALEFILTLVEAREKAPGMMKKLPLFCHNSFALLLNLLLDIKEEPSLYSWEYIYEAGIINNFEFGVSCLKRFSDALGGKTVSFIAMEQLDSYVVSPMWEKRHAALIALLCIANGCSKVMIKYLDRVVSMVLHSSQDPHPQVRWAAIRSIAQLAIDFSPDLQEQYHDQVVPTLVAAMDDSQHPRVQAIAALAVHNYFNNYVKKLDILETLLPYLDSILDKLHVLVQNDNQMVQQVAIDALGVLAESSKEHFKKYYGFIMPHLKNILVNANDKSNHMLHSKALGCISMIEMAVGREEFRDDAKQVMEVLMSSLESPAKEFGSIFHILKAWARIGYCMGKEFLPYMSTIMPFLVKCAQLQSDNTIDESNNSIHKVKLGDEIIYAKRSDFLEVKSLACVQFGSYARILEEDFYPWISQATSTLFPLLKFYIHNNVRENSRNALYWMLKSAKLAVEKGIAQGKDDLYFKHLSCNIIVALGDSLYTEPETKICLVTLRSLVGCLEICGPRLSEEMLPSIMDMIKHVLTESSRRRGELTKREKSEDFDAEEAELLREETEEEEFIYEVAGYLLRRLVEIFKDAFLPFHDELLSYLMPTRVKDKTNAESMACIHIFNGLLMQCGQATLKYYDLYIPLLLESSNKERPYLRQCALFGLGLCAEHGVPNFRPFIGGALPKINEVITYLYAREPKNEYAYDNAVSTLGKICLFHPEGIDSAKIIPVWLHCLPIKGDKVEAKVVHNQLCSMIERSDRELLGPKYEHFPKFLSVFSEVLCAGKELATEETIKRMFNVLRNLKKRVPPATWASAVSLLLPQQEMELEYVVSPEEDANL